MKIHIDIDCTPEEARHFFGLPNVQPMQEALMARLQDRMARYFDAMEPEALMKIWFPGGLTGLSAFQEQLWRQFMGSAGESRASGAKPDDKRS